MEFRGRVPGENGVTSFFEQISPSRLGRGKMVLPLFFLNRSVHRRYGGNREEVKTSPLNNEMQIIDRVVVRRELGPWLGTQRP